MAEARAKATEGALGGCLNFLSCRTIPLLTRARALGAYVCSVARFGGELVGCCDVRARATDRILARGMKAVAGFGLNSNCVSRLTLIRELGLVSTHAAWSGARVRLYKKVGELRSFIRVLADNVAGRSHLTVTKSWLTRAGGGIEADDPAGYGREVSKHVMELAISNINTVSGRAHAPYAASSEKVLLASQNMGVRGNAVLDYVKIRMGAYWTTPKLTRFANNIGAQYTDKCPLCGADVPETETHYIMYCGRWTGERQATIGVLMDGRVGGLLDEAMMRFLFGARGARDVLEPEYAQTLELDLDQFSEAVMSRVVAFLHATRRARWQLLWSLPA